MFGDGAEFVVRKSYSKMFYLILLILGGELCKMTPSFLYSSPFFSQFGLAVFPCKVGLPLLAWRGCRLPGVCYFFSVNDQPQQEY